MLCIHKDSEKTWLPRLDNHILVPHPICSKCGFVKNVTRDKGRKMGYYINVLYRIKGGIEKKKVGKLTEIQIRLISKELEKTEAFQDPYSIKGSTQDRLFVETVKKYTNLTHTLVELFI
jgi:hypothetical protein